MIVCCCNNISDRDLLNFVVDDKLDINFRCRYCVDEIIEILNEKDVPNKHEVISFLKNEI